MIIPTPAPLPLLEPSPAAGFCAAGFAAAGLAQGWVTYTVWVTVDGRRLRICVGGGPWAKTVVVRNSKAGAFGLAGAAGAAAALPAVLFDDPPSGAASPAVLFDAPAAGAGVDLAAAVTVSFTVLVIVCAAALPPFFFPFSWPASSAPKSPNSPATPPPPFPFPFLASMPSPTRRISWEKPLALTSDRYPISSSRYCR